MITEGGVRLTIDAETDTYEQAMAAVQAAYGLRPIVPDSWPPAPTPDPRPDPLDLGSDDLGDGWTEQLLFRTFAARSLPGPGQCCEGSPSWAAPPPTTRCSSTSPRTLPAPSRNDRSAGPQPASRRCSARSARSARTDCSSGTSRPGSTASTRPWWPDSTASSRSLAASRTGEQTLLVKVNEATWLCSRVTTAFVQQLGRRRIRRLLDAFDVPLATRAAGLTHEGPALRLLGSSGGLLTAGQRRSRPVAEERRLATWEL